MVLKLIDDMNNALKANYYFAALAIALMLPDICGKAEYHINNISKRYTEWYDKKIGCHEVDPEIDPEGNSFPYLSGEVVYQLRNAFFHQGTPNINKEKILYHENKIDNFELIIESEKEDGVYCDVSGCVNCCKTYRVNVRRLCMIIGLTAKKYYEENKEKFDFFQYKIIDLDEERKRFCSLKQE